MFKLFNCGQLNKLFNYHLIRWSLFNCQFGQSIFGKSVICSFEIGQLDLFRYPLSSQPTTESDLKREQIAKNYGDPDPISSRILYSLTILSASEKAGHSLLPTFAHSCVSFSLSHMSRLDCDGSDEKFRAGLAELLSSRDLLKM